MDTALVAETILLIAADPTVRDVVNPALVTVDRQVIVVGTGAEAIAQVAYQRPSLVLVQERSSSQETLMLCQLLRDHPLLETTPILLITETQSKLDQDKAIQYGVTDYLSQPLTSQGVQIRVETWLRLQELERQSLCQQQKLQRTEQSLRLLLHALSHDLRNQVLGTQMVFQNLLRGTGLPCAAQDDIIPVPRSFIERVTQCSDRHLSLLDSLLDTHAEATRPLCLHYAPVALDQFIPTILGEMKPWLQKNQATLSYTIPDTLPVISIDPIQICRVLKNLVENALKHNPPGVKVQVSVGLLGDRIQCSVQDNGVGIAPDQCEDLFKLFERGPNTRHTSGLGVGLYLCQQIIRAHGGEIHVENCPGSGARFWFLLPLHPDSPAECNGYR